MHSWANRRAGGKKEIGYIYIIIQIDVLYRIAVLIDSFKLRYGMVNSINNGLPVNYFGAYIAVTGYRQALYIIIKFAGGPHKNYDRCNYQFFHVIFLVLSSIYPIPQ